MRVKNGGYHVMELVDTAKKMYALKYITQVLLLRGDKTGSVNK
jgi:hypothetical protein